MLYLRGAPGAVPGARTVQGVNAVALVRQEIPVGIDLEQVALEIECSGGAGHRYGRQVHPVITLENQPAKYRLPPVADLLMRPMGGIVVGDECRPQMGNRPAHARRLIVLNVSTVHVHRHLSEVKKTDAVPGLPRAPGRLHFQGFGWTQALDS